ncbi:hypothetical protein RHGRI_013807 [Rhododendron griersonianum]|uniref:Retrotransposon Copia-like N-terminal domain-containing protein n=1 Tax=Rhododendron griersonianum TaxID=479676 RepID=A0AAV6K6W7_9ERIC|nr:hypothetical protein RHGRI_013807 [Rhododendron griersonianum]
MNWTESSLELRVITWAAGAIPTLGLPIKWGYGFSLSNRRRFSVFIMSEKNVESTGTKTESEVLPFNAGIVLNKSNYDVWSQLMEMHIAAEGEKLSYICGNTQQPKQSEDGYEKCPSNGSVFIFSSSDWIMILNRFVHGEVLRKEPVPDLEECYALVRREAVRRATLNGESNDMETSVKEPVPDLKECYALVRREAVCHATLNGESDDMETSVISSQ